MIIHIVTKGYTLLDERGLPHGTVRAIPIGVHISLKKAIEQINKFDFAAEAKKHDCDGYSETVHTSGSRAAVLLDFGRKECLSKVWVCSRKLEL